MSRLIRAELQKLWTVRSTKVTIAAALAVIGPIAFAVMDDIGRPGGSPPGDARELLVIGPGLVVAILMLAVGVIGAAGEVQHHLLPATYLATPRRAPVLWAKLVTYAAVGAGVALAAAAIGFPISLAAAGARDVHIAAAGEIAAIVAAVTAAGALAAVLGVAVGSLVRTPTAGLLTAFGFATLAERVLAGIIPNATPFTALLSAVGLRPEGAAPVGVSLAVAAAWAGALVAATYRWSLRRDLS